MDKPQPPSATVPALPISGPQRLHPTSILFDVLSSAGRLAIAAAIAFFASGTNSLVALSAAALVGFISSLGATVRYLTVRYELIQRELRIDEGLLFRRHRTIPVSRIQNIDLLQNPLHHWLGVAEVRIETAGGSEPEAQLNVLSLDDVERLRSSVFAAAPPEHPASSQLATQLGSEPSDRAPIGGDGALAPQQARANTTPPAALHHIGIGRLVAAGLISNRGFILVPVVMGFLHELDLERRVDVDRLRGWLPQEWSSAQAILGSIIGAVALLLVLRLFSVLWFILRFYGYRLERRGEDLRVSCGLLTRISATVPRHRIQLVSVQQTVLGRWFGLATVRLETAGGAGKSDEDAAETVARRWFLPVLHQTEVPAILGHLRPGLERRLDDLHWQSTAPRTAQRLLRAALVAAVGVGGIGSWVLPPWGWLSGVVALGPLGYLAIRYARSLKYARTESWIVFRSGILTRKTSFTFFDKVQTAAVRQSPFDRRWDMATLVVDTAAAGPAQHPVRVRYLPTSVANTELVQISTEASHTQLIQA